MLAGAGTGAGGVSVGLGGDGGSGGDGKNVAFSHTQRDALPILFVPLAMIPVVC